MNNVINLKERNILELKLLNKISDKSSYKSIKRLGSRTGVLYSLGK